MNRNDVKRKRSSKGLINPERTKTYLVTHEENLLDFVKKHLPKQSEKNVKRIIANHQVAINGAPVSYFYEPLFNEDEVTIAWEPIRRYQRNKPPIIYEDDDIIAINKPSGLLSVASEKEKGRTAYRLIADYLSNFKRGARPYVVHRLDEDTSGVLIFAKKIEVREALQKSWQQVVSKRAYFAVVEPGTIEDNGVLQDYLAIDRTQKMYVTANKKYGKLAITKFKTLKRNAKYALLDVNIDSGRKNQIRVQLGHHGYYVVGDDKYGKPSNPLKRLALHAYELSFVSPLTGKEYDFKTPCPKEFLTLFNENLEAKDKKKSSTFIRQRGKSKR